VRVVDTVELLQWLDFTPAVCQNPLQRQCDRFLLECAGILEPSAARETQSWE
jgi:hypothetical protein